ETNRDSPTCSGRSGSHLDRFSIDVRPARGREIPCSPGVFFLGGAFEEEDARQIVVVICQSTPQGLYSSNQREGAKPPGADERKPQQRAPLAQTAERLHGKEKV